MSKLAIWLIVVQKIHKSFNTSFIADKIAWVCIKSKPLHQKLVKLISFVYFDILGGRAWTEFWEAANHLTILRSISHSPFLFTGELVSFFLKWSCHCSCYWTCLKLDIESLVKFFEALYTITALNTTMYKFKLLEYAFEQTIHGFILIPAKGKTHDYFMSIHLTDELD